MKFVAKVAISVSLAVTVDVAAAQVVSVAQEPELTVVNGSDLHRARGVLKRFFATEKNPGCYQIGFTTFEGNLRVDFMPKRGDPVAVAGRSSEKYARPCGRNVGYVIDERGKVLRKIYSR